MITPAQYRRLVKEYQSNGGVVSHAAMKANMHPETAARYLKANAGPEEHKQEKGPRAYRTRPDPLKELMPEAAHYLEAAPEIEAKGVAGAPEDFEARVGWERRAAHLPARRKGVAGDERSAERSVLSSGP